MKENILQKYIFVAVDTYESRWILKNRLSANNVKY
jgi:hypothetical protein